MLATSTGGSAGSSPSSRPWMSAWPCLPLKLRSARSGSLIYSGNLCRPPSKKRLNSRCSWGALKRSSEQIKKVTGQPTRLLARSAFRRPRSTSRHPSPRRRTSKTTRRPSKPYTPAPIRSEAQPAPRSLFVSSRRAGFFISLSFTEDCPL